MKRRLSAILCAGFLMAGLTCNPGFASSKGTETSSNSSAAKKTSVIPEVPFGTELSKKETEDLVKKVNEKTSSLKNMEFKGITEMYVMKTIHVQDMSGIYDFENNISKVIMSGFSGNSMESYTKDRKSYVSNPYTGEWFYLDLPEKFKMKNNFIINENSLSLLKSEELPEGYVVKSAKPLSIDEFLNITTENTSEMELRGLVDQMKVEIGVAFIIDKEYKMTGYHLNIKLTPVQTAGELNINSFTSYSNFDSAPTVNLPEEIKSAKPIKMNETDPANSSNTKQ